MVVAFSDTSALLKLYIEEIGSQWMAAVRTDGIAISALAVAEVRVSLVGRVRSTTLSDDDALSVWRAFRRDLRSFLVRPLDRPSLVNAGLLATRSPVLLRTLDAIHFQGAIETAADARRLGQSLPLFVSADTRQLSAAAALGFTTDNPLNHR